VDTGVLKSMRRGYTEKVVRDLVERVRKQNNRIWLRTTMLVGHPGESEEAYINLRRFVEEGHIDHLGVFPWSKEDGTTSAMRPGRIDLAIAEARAAELMAIQEQLRLRRHLEMVGQELEVMIDGVSEESEFLLEGRHEGQAPDIDGKCIVTDGTAERGEFVKTRVINATAHELIVSMDLGRGPDEAALEALEDLNA
jgi:ribosomal protein S12 methylthiotransferase